MINFTSPAGWLPVHRDQLRVQRSVTSMGKLYLFYPVMWPYVKILWPLVFIKLHTSFILQFYFKQYELGKFLQFITCLNVTDFIIILLTLQTWLNHKPLRQHTKFYTESNIATINLSTYSLPTTHRNILIIIILLALKIHCEPIYNANIQQTVDMATMETIQH